jgi:hypothetical protein
MCSLPAPPPIASAAAVFCGQHGAVTRLARLRGVFRQTLYREAHAVVAAVDGGGSSALVSALQQQIASLQAQVTQLQQQLQNAIVVTADQHAEFASVAQAQGVSFSAARSLLKVLLRKRTPSLARLGRLAQQAARRAKAALAVLDEPAQRQARQVAADEIFVGRRPVLMTIEQQSLCWLGGRLADSRDGQEWAKEFAKLPQAEQVTRDGGQGMEKGLQIVNAQREKAGQKAIADQEDHFHILHRGRRGLREVRAKALRAYRKAEKAEAKLKRDRRKRKQPGGRAAAVVRYWRQAEQAFDRWSAQEKSFQRLQAGLRLWTPEGELNTRQRAEAETQAALAGLTGPEWSRLRTKLVSPKAFTFLDRVAEKLHALPVSAELREAALRVEGLKRQPEALRGEEASAGAMRGVMLAWGLVLSLSGEAGAQALSMVREVLKGAWRSSSLVEGVNSVLRMQQRRQKRMTPGLLDLKRLYWNMHVFVAGRRKGKSPYERLGLKVPEEDWWQLLKMPPEQLREEVSALNTAV